MMVTRALDAMGPTGATATMGTLVLKGSAKFWEPEQSSLPGSEMRFANDSRLFDSKLPSHEGNAPKQERRKHYCRN